MLRHGRLAYAELLGDVTHRTFAFHDHAQDAKPERVGKGLEKVARAVCRSG